MQRLMLTSFLIFMVTLSFGQTAEELNQKSKDLLSKQDFKNAVPLLRKAAQGGSPEAEYNYGVCYQQGIEVVKSDSISTYWFLKSAKLGWKDAQFKIAYSYANGRYLKKDDRQALNWSIKCAEQDDPECMFNVVQCYFQGIGTTKNVDSVLTWSTRLALLPDPDNLQLSGKITSARVNLAVLYREGSTVPKNPEKSYMWFLIYNENKRDFSFADQQQNIDIIKNLENQLTTKEKLNAINDAQNMLKHKLTNIANLYKADLD